MYDDFTGLRRVVRDNLIEIRVRIALSRIIVMLFIREGLNKCFSSEKPIGIRALYDLIVFKNTGIVKALVRATTPLKSRVFIGEASVLSDKASSSTGRTS